MWYRYELCGPIDYFSGCVQFNDYVKEIYESNDLYPESEFDIRERFKALSQIYGEVSEAMQGFVSWEGDIVENGLLVFALPCDSCETKVGFIWKQENNGSTFVASPFPLPWLEGCAV